MEKIEYAALKYYNSPVSEECLYVGMLFNNLSTQTRTFKSIKNFRRLSAFDDEISVPFFKDYLLSIKDDVENNLFNLNSEFNLREYAKPFVNELRFSSIRSEITDDLDFIENISKLFLKFDYEKKERLSKNTELKYIRRILKSANIPYSSNHSIKGLYNESITFDLVTQEYAIKYFKFKEKDLKKLISTAKTWSYNASELKNEKKTIFMYDSDIVHSSDFTIILNILKSDAERVLPIEAGIDFITTISS